MLGACRPHSASQMIANGTHTAAPMAMPCFATRSMGRTSSVACQPSRSRPSRKLAKCSVRLISASLRSVRRSFASMLIHFDTKAGYDVSRRTPLALRVVP